MKNSTEGVLGRKIFGAGLGECVVTLVEKYFTDRLISKLNKEYYNKNGFEHGAGVSVPSSGSTAKLRSRYGI